MKGEVMGTAVIAGELEQSWVVCLGNARQTDLGRTQDTKIIEN